MSITDITMLPAIVIVLFCQGAISAAHFFSVQKEENRAIAAFLIVIFGLLPAWQTAEVVWKGMQNTLSPYSRYR